MRTNLTALGAVVILTASTRGEEPVDYVRDVKPLLRARCYSCHGALKQRGGLRVDTAALLREGGDTGPAVVPGSEKESLLLQKVASANKAERMPPDGEPLSPAEIAVLRDWVKRGARGPVAEKSEEDPREHWAFRRPRRAEVPTVKAGAWVRNPVDAFLAAEQERRGLSPAGPAPKHVLLRRVYLDLTGLPPTRAELHAFLADDSPDAYEGVVERLLASPAYGERWGRHWLDVWRYSDWYGRRQVNDVRNSYPHVWRWRDWVVRSLNEGKGYDRMVREMLAADEICPTDDENIVALGFVVRSWFSLNYDQWMKDLVEHTGKAFLGVRLNCCHCHDHKYDPFTQEEYFRFRAFFEPLELRHDRVPGGPPVGKYERYVPGSGASLKPIPAGLARVYDFDLDARTFMYRLGDARDRFEGRPPVTPGVPAALGGRKVNIEPIDLPPRAWYPGLKPWLQRQEIGQREQALQAAEAALAKARTDPLAQARHAEAVGQLEAVRARVAADNARHGKGPGDPEELARRASKAERRANVAAARVGVVASEQAVKAAEAAGKKAPELTKLQQQLAAAGKALAAAEKARGGENTTFTPLGPTYPARSTGRRRALAEWIASGENPLTARVAVNHVWMRHFGRPLVESVFDFGRGGKQPTHPGLLDWLAVEFVESGWSLKHLHRLLVTSNAYRLASRMTEGDAENRYYTAFSRRRAEAEVIRDSLLRVSGRLDGRLGGPEIAVSQEADSRRRSLYFALYPEAGGAMRFLAQFDPPDPGECYRRKETLIPQQALALTNSALMKNASRLLARRLWEEVSGGSGEEPTRRFLAAAFEEVLSRPCTEEEVALCSEFLAKQEALFRAAPAGTLGGAAGKGIVPASTDPAARAREGLVRVLFNHHEFVTIP